MLSYTQIFGLLALVVVAAFFSSAEIALAAASRTRLQTFSDEGDRRAALVLEMQEHPGKFFSAMQIMQNACALLGGIVGGFVLWRRLVEVGRILQEKKRLGVQKLKQAMSELASWRKSFRDADEHAEDVKEALEQF